MSDTSPTTEGSVTWSVQPLDGKYYGTIIESSDGEEIKIWHSTGYTPSTRQLAEWGLTNWDAPTEEDLDMLSDSHWESQYSYDRACKIVAALNAAFSPGASDELAFQVLEMYGVPRTRAKTVHNGIMVLAERIRKSEQSPEPEEKGACPECGCDLPEFVVMHGGRRCDKCRHSPEPGTKPETVCPDGEDCSHGCRAPACFRYPVGQSTTRTAPEPEVKPESVNKADGCPVCFVPWGACQHTNPPKERK